MRRQLRREKQRRHNCQKSWRKTPGSRHQIQTRKVSQTAKEPSLRKSWKVRRPPFLRVSLGHKLETPICEARALQSLLSHSHSNQSLNSQSLSNQSPKDHTNSLIKLILSRQLKLDGNNHSLSQLTILELPISNTHRQPSTHSQPEPSTSTHHQLR